MTNKYESYGPKQVSSAVIKPEREDAEKYLVLNGGVKEAFRPAVPG